MTPRHFDCSNSLMERSISPMKAAFSALAGGRLSVSVAMPVLSSTLCVVNCGGVVVPVLVQ